MKRSLLISISVTALLIFLGVQTYLLHNIWQQKEEQLILRYKALSREAFSAMIKKSGKNGFEKSMSILDIFSELIKDKELPNCRTGEDTLILARQAMKEAGSIIIKNETLTGYIRNYIGHTGNDTTFNSIIKVRRYRIFLTGIDLEESGLHENASSLVFVNSFREERNNFVVEYDFFIDLNNRNRIVFRETILSMSLILLSLIIVILIYWFTWRNLMEERRLSELKSDFINNMTHELKTPLSTITVAGRTLEIEKVRKDDAKVLDTARMIGKQSIHLNQLINTILEVSLLERTEFSLDKKPIMVDELLHEITEAFITSCNNGVEIKENLSCGETLIQTDILYFTTMINNLLSNAVKYCNGEPIINVASSAGVKMINITIADNGIGIASEHLDQIFEKFYRVPTGNIHKVKGLGLGLYYVKRIARAHGGDVTVTSKPGKGTTFVISIPRK
jgi:two-component system, OmpR family, phosphate regulon sensor histidine kinase PhoR